MSGWFGKFRKRPKSNISALANVARGIRVACHSGVLMGLPKSWQEMLDEQITSEQQTANPDAVNKAIKFFIEFRNATKLNQSSEIAENTDDVAVGPVDDTAPSEVEGANQAPGPTLRQKDAASKQVSRSCLTMASENPRSDQRFRSR
jgi:P21-Rho-binding domain